MLKLISIFVLVEAGLLPVLGQFTADWDSLDSRTNPEWYDDSKIGIFLHWGLYSVPSFGTEWFWSNWEGKKNPRHVKYMTENYRPGFTYQDFGPLFTAEFYEPDEWAELFQAAGARYVVLTSKHHEGFTMWPSTYSWGWNAKDLGPKRDLLGDLANSIRNKTPSIHFGIYHSLYEWFNPLFLRDKENKLQTNDFVTSKTMPELYELVERYAPDVIWSDGEWEAPDTYWNSTAFLSWLFNESPVKDSVVVNDRWGSGDVLCHHGSFYTCADRYNPGVLQTHKWENCMTLDKKSWGYNRRSKADDYLTIQELLTTMIETVSCGGNLLVNAGPTHDGRIPPIMEERLRQMGKWLDINGEAIYSSKPWTYQNDSLTSDAWYTARESAVYATVLSWPSNETLTLGSVTAEVAQDVDAITVNMLGYQDQLETSMSEDGLEISFPPMSRVSSEWAYVLKLEGLTINA